MHAKRIVLIIAAVLVVLVAGLAWWSPPSGAPGLPAATSSSAASLAQPLEQVITPPNIRLSIHKFWQRQESGSDSVWLYRAQGLVFIVSQEPSTLATLAERMAEVNAIQATGYEGQPSVTVVGPEESLTLGGKAAVLRKETWNAAGFDAVVVYTLHGGHSFAISLYREDGATPTPGDLKFLREILGQVDFS